VGPEHAVQRLDVPAGRVSLAVELHTLGAQARPLVCFVPGGATDPGRTRPITSPWELRQIRHLAGAGCDALTLNFPGIGHSRGELADNTLRRRGGWVAAAIAAADARIRRGPLVLVGCSMGAHVAALLSDELPVSALALVAPAAYGADAADEPFGPALRACIRRPGSWRDSPAFAAVRRFEGDVLLLLPERDAVIPAGVTEGYARAAGDSAVTVSLREASHHMLRSGRAIDRRAREEVCRRVAWLASRVSGPPEPRASALEHAGR